GRSGSSSSVAGASPGRAAAVGDAVMAAVSRRRLDSGNGPTGLVPMAREPRPVAWGMVVAALYAHDPRRPAGHCEGAAEQEDSDRWRDPCGGGPSSSGWSPFP